MMREGLFINCVSNQCFVNPNGLSRYLQVPVAPNYWGYGLHYCDNMLGSFSDQASSLRYSGAVAGDTWATSINLYTEQVLEMV